MANILVVDDEVGIRELLMEILSDEGHVVYMAENAREARERRVAHALDLVLLDIWMPDTDGVTLLKEWQRNGHLTMPVIMMSGHATIDTAVEATRIGALNFLEKPIALQKLLGAVKGALAHKQDALVKTPEKQPSLPPVTVQASAGTTSQAVPGLERDTLSVSDYVALPVSHTILESFDLPLREARDLFERIYFEYHLTKEGGSMTKVAEKTGLERTHLYRKLKQLGVEAVKNSRKG